MRIVPLVYIVSLLIPLVLWSGNAMGQDQIPTLRDVEKKNEWSASRNVMLPAATGQVTAVLQYLSSERSLPSGESLPYLLHFVKLTKNQLYWVGYAMDAYAVFADGIVGLRAISGDILLVSYQSRIKETMSETSEALCRNQVLKKAARGEDNQHVERIQLSPNILGPSPFQDEGLSRPTPPAKITGVSIEGSVMLVTLRGYNGSEAVVTMLPDMTVKTASLDGRVVYPEPNTQVPGAVP